MGILVNKNTKVIVQGITGRQGRFHTYRMLQYGTKILGGVTPGRGGTEIHGVSVYDTVEEARTEIGDIDASVIFVPAAGVKAAAVEAIINGIGLIVIITEHIPVMDTLKILEESRKRGGIVIGPNCPGIITPDEALLGIIPPSICRRGNIGIVSRSGTLTYEIIRRLTESGFGISTAVGIGGDPVHGIGFIECLEKFAEDKNTEAVVIIGEIGGDEEERTAEYIAQGYNKPVVAFIAGRTAPPGKKMGHAGAIVSGESGTAESKIRAFEEAGVKVARLPGDIPKILDASGAGASRY